MIRFSLDEQAYTPVPTSFLKKFMCNAPEKYLKVYLYGIYLAHSNQQLSDVELEEELHQSTTEIEAALGYWASKGLVKARVSGKSVSYEFSSGYENTEETPVPVKKAKAPLYEYENYNNVLNTLLDRTLSPNELEKIYDFDEIYGLPQDVVISLIEYCTAEKGARVSVNYLDKVAQAWAEEGITTREQAQEKIEEYRNRSGGATKLLKLMGIHGKYSDKTQMDYYEKWTQSWGFTHESIVFAMKGLEFPGSQPFRYLDSVLRNLYEKGATTSRKINEYNTEYTRRNNSMKEILQALEYSRIVVSPKCERFYNEWMEAGFAHSTILLACHQSVKNGSRKFENVGALLKEWAELKLSDDEEIKKHLRKQNTIEKKVKQVYDLAGIDKQIGEPDIRNYLKFTKEHGLPHDVLMFAAEISSLSEHPLSFMNKVLKDWAENNINTLEKAREQNLNRFKNDLKAKKGFEQRTYTKEEDEREIAEAYAELEKLYAK
ncbi:MAG: DnaD domain protein [Christensenellaceae bacterium]|jgi:DnaD/phage-associated family protein